MLSKADIDKERIVSVLNKKHGTALTVELLERVIAAGLSSWESLQREIARIAHDESSPRRAPSDVSRAGAAGARRMTEGTLSARADGMSGDETAS